MDLSFFVCNEMPIYLLAWLFLCALLFLRCPYFRVLGYSCVHAPCADCVSLSVGAH
jgi:hypothetical protein